MNQQVAAKRFVVIDDEPSSIRTVIEYLEGFGAQSIKSFENARDALEYCNTHPVDCVICDWEMPEMSGLDLLREIRKTPTLQDLPFIMITSPISMEQMKVIGAGLNKVNSYLIKPFRGRALLEKILEGEIDRRFAARKAVILADDDDSVRALVTDVLKDMGFEPVHATDRAEKAYQLLQEHHETVAFVMSDWEMPEMTGIELLQRVRANSTLKHTPFVIITSQTSLETLKIQQAVIASVDYYLVKPIKIDTLKEKIQALLKETRDREHYQLQTRIAQEALAEEDLAEAKRHFEAAKAIDPKDLEAYRGLAKVELSRKPTRDLKEAARHLQEAIQIAPKAIEIYLELALVYEMALAPEKGTHLLREALQFAPNDPEIHFQIGRLLAKRGKIEESVASLQRTLELDSKHDNAKLLLENVMTIKPIYKKK